MKITRKKQQQNDSWAIIVLPCHDAFFLDEKIENTLFGSNFEGFASKFETTLNRKVHVVCVFGFVIFFSSHAGGVV